MGDKNFIRFSESVKIKKEMHVAGVTVNRKNLAEEFNIPEDLEIDTVIALGYPAEESVWEDEKGSIRYYKDENNVLHVPKRKLDDITYWNTMD